jgi:hypothetical protein
MSFSLALGWPVLIVLDGKLDTRHSWIMSTLEFKIAQL